MVLNDALKLIYPEKQNNLMPLQTRNTIHDNDYIISHFTPKYYVNPSQFGFLKLFLFAINAIHSLNFKTITPGSTLQIK
jgi:hypothetical protein